MQEWRERFPHIPDLEAALTGLATTILAKGRMHPGWTCPEGWMVKPLSEINQEAADKKQITAARVARASNSSARCPVAARQEQEERNSMKPEELSDPELERALLAALLADNSGFDHLGQLEPDDLADPMHGAVLAAALDLRSENRAVNLITLRSRFASVPFGDDGSVLNYLKGCEFAGNATEVGDMAVALRELSQRREIVELGERIAGSVHDHAVGPGTLLTDAARSVDDLLAKCRPAGKTLWAMPEAVQDLLSASDDKDLCVPTGFTDFDNATSGGFRRGELGIIGGRPSMGKSALALAIARRVAAPATAYCSTRWRCSAATACAVWRRMHAGRGSLPFPTRRLGPASSTTRERRAYEQGARTLADLPLLIEEGSGLLLSEIASGTRRTAERFEREGSGSAW